MWIFETFWQHGPGPREIVLAASGALPLVRRASLGDAATLLPEVSWSVLSQSYGDAFRVLPYILTAITVIAAFAVFGVLGRAATPSPEPEEADVEGTHQTAPAE